MLFKKTGRVCWTEVAVSFPELDLMAPPITGVFERLWHCTDLSGTANSLWITAPTDSFSSPMTAFNWLSMSPVYRGWCQAPHNDDHGAWTNAGMMTTRLGVCTWEGTDRNKNMYFIICDGVWDFRGEAWYLGGVEERLIKKKQHSGQHVHSYCRILKIVRMRVLAGHSTKCCPLIKVWELNQTTRHSYLPIQHLFDSSIREAARLLWRAAWLSLPKVAFRERDKLHPS